jgi:DnaJ-class molecular chaperone
MRDPYDILGLKRSATEAEIKSAYRRLAKQLHPDRNTSDPKAKDKFSELTSAYEIIGDSQKKAQFDRGEIGADGKPRYRAQDGFGGRSSPRGDFEEFSFGNGPPRGAQRGGANPGDLFSDLFTSAFRGGQGRGSQLPRGEDVSATLSITLEDIVSEEKKRITLPTGRDVDINLPKGITDGQVIRLKNLGHQSPFGGETGDLLLTLQILPHPLYTRDGQDLRLQLMVDLEDAILGSTNRVQTLQGVVEMKTPPMTSSGRTFRLKGKGLPGKERNGDLLVTIMVRLPDQASEDLLDYARKKQLQKAQT